MSGLAIFMMILAIMIIWGGLVASTIFLVRNPMEQPHPILDEHDFEAVPDDAADVV